VNQVGRYARYAEDRREALEADAAFAVSLQLTELIRYMRQWNGKPSQSRCARTTKLRVLSSESAADRFRGRGADLDGSTRGTPCAKLPASGELSAYGAR
jgi:hypothetical protein